MPQLSYAAGYTIGFPGQRMGSEHQSGSYINDLGSSPQVDDITIGTAPPVAQTQVFAIPASPDDSVNYTITINGIACVAAADANSTQAEVRDAMIAAINTAVGTAVTATASGNDVLVTSDVPGTGFTFSIDTGTTADITAGAATANVGTGTVFSFTINGVLVSYTGLAGDTIQDVRDGLIAAARALPELEDIVSVQPNGNGVRITAVTPGVGMTVAESDANLSVAHTTANVASQTIIFGRAVVKRTGAGTTDQSATLPSATGQVFLGVTERSHTVVDPATPLNGVGPFRLFTAVYHGDMVVEVEQAVAFGDPVYFRHTAAGTEQVGMFRKDADTSDADAVTGAMFVSSTTGAGLAIARFK